jgi:putative DNA primase/helicase
MVDCLMELINFCRAHGILIDSPPPIDVWRRYPTDDHPNKRNGAVKFMGDHAFVQNHAMDTEVSVWQPDTPVKIDRAKIARDLQAVEDKRRADQREAANKAAFIMKSCQLGRHDYLKRKGFPDAEGYIWVHEGKQFLILPMRVQGHLVGCQMIDQEGGKKFLYGQRTSNAEIKIDNGGVDILCEGYATALSIQSVLKRFKRRYVIHVCFSAGNMKKIAADLKPGIVVADNDASGTGERVAKEIGWKYWMSDVVGEDANDTHVRLGNFTFGQSLLKVL